MEKIIEDEAKNNIELSKNDISVHEFRERAENAGLTQEEIENWIQENELAMEGKGIYTPFSLTPTSVYNVK